MIDLRDPVERAAADRLVPGARLTIAQGLSDLLAAFRARDPLAAADRMTAFIHQAEDSHRRLTAKDQT